MMPDYHYCDEPGCHANDEYPDTSGTAAKVFEEARKKGLVKPVP